MKYFNEVIPRLFITLIILKIVIVSSETRNNRQSSNRFPRILDGKKLFDSSKNPSKSSLNSTILKKVTEAANEDIPISFPGSNNNSDPSILSSKSSKESRILDRKSSLKSPENLKSVSNSTSVKEVNEDDAEVHVPSAKIVDSSPMDFRPSVHIGEILDYDSRKRKSSATGPFNKIHHVKFENSVSIDDGNTGRVPSSSSPSVHDDDRPMTRTTRTKSNNRVHFVPTASRYSIALPVEYYVSHEMMQQPQQHDAEENAENEDNINYNNQNNENEENNGNHVIQIPIMQHESLQHEYPASHYAQMTLRPAMTFENLGHQPAAMIDQHHQQVENYEPMSITGVRTVYVKPSKFQGEVTPASPIHVQHYEYVIPGSPNDNEANVKPQNFIAQHQQYGHYPTSESNHNALKPETVVFLSSHRETAFTRTRNFPYKFYHPESIEHGSQHFYSPDERHSYMTKENRISPWKKIIHLIGAFIPLGLLLAALKPNVIQVENSTRPNIVLSKLRDLPIEHKLAGRLDSCEDKSICQLIVNGSQPHANLLENILWDLTNRSSDEEAKKHGLDEIFTAVKQKDCSSIDC